MSDELQQLVQSQSDILKCKFLGEGKLTTSFKVAQLYNGKIRNQVVRVYRSIGRHYAIKREKDLLHFFNQFDDFIPLNEIRKVGDSYLQFFDYVGKYTLQKKVKKKGVYTQQEAKRLLKDMVSVLEHLSTISFVHSCISPDHIVVGKTRSYLIDWSYSIPSIASYETESISQDLRYTPPERMNARHDIESDVYSLGCTLYYALTGKHIYNLKAKHPIEAQLWAHANDSIHKQDKLPTLWRDLLNWMTHKDPDRRPCLNDLHRWLDDLTVPSWVKQPPQKPNEGVPEKPLHALADSHWLYPTYLLAMQYEQDEEYASAFNLYESCAGRNYSLAEYRLGLMYERGNPIERSYENAIKNYRSAFQKGNPDAAYRLARMYEKGLGLDVNAEYAYNLHKHAATRGHIAAQNALAIMYLSGNGTHKNLAQAHSWLNLAASSGCKEAKENLNILLDKAKQLS